MKSRPKHLTAAKIRKLRAELRAGQAPRNNVTPFPNLPHRQPKELSLLPTLILFALFWLVLIGACYYMSTPISHIGTYALD